MSTIQNVIEHLEYLAPPSYQESYDNSGLLVGNAGEQLTGVLITLDCTESVVQEAVTLGCNLIVAHHPILFKGLKRLNGNTYVERTILLAIQHQVAIYAIHTNLDHVLHGVNARISEKLGLKNCKILAPKGDLLSKLTFYVPEKNAPEVVHALHETGAGHVGNYSHCSFQSAGTGTFRPENGANPQVGVIGEIESVAEKKIELLIPSHLEKKVLNTLRAVHPYEEVAYYLQALENLHQEVGAGAVGELPEPMPIQDFLNYLKERMSVSVIKYTSTAKKMVQKVAVCGGAGSFLLPHAHRVQADAFVTSDFKYHEFFDAENRLMICDIGHYESEVCTKDLLFDYLSKKSDNFALYLSQVNTNPVSYFV
ncbi:Nif3-like dinuclear metal center hexameric protein [Arundinibacter roseus]|uniref:GTP cyclohydrolase 1 type 2 homolog n=1 Tax=Arundinibacter roseus TaxID=2070510 RepID=A0A4R4KCS7_9BACT|nr:Nif3-like dinuclear metal center hexameric protein [Arundinibacter roseus]TDB64652.1 Nif3-like dinuclear metal center hexameric protein [Arundinibacter roseus]